MIWRSSSEQNALTILARTRRDNRVRRYICQQSAVWPHRPAKTSMRSFTIPSAGRVWAGEPSNNGGHAPHTLPAGRLARYGQPPRHHVHGTPSPRRVVVISRGRALTSK